MLAKPALGRQGCVSIRWGHIYVATQLHNSPPVYQHQQVHRGGGGWLQHTGLY